MATETPTEADFLSHKARGRRPPRDPELLPLWDGVSVYNSAQAAFETALYYWPRLGRFLAVMELPDIGPIAQEKTTRHPAHYTLWGEPTQMLECVVSVIPVVEGGDDESASS